MPLPVAIRTIGLLLAIFACFQALGQQSFEQADPQLLRALMPAQFTSKQPIIQSFTSDYTLDKKIIFRALARQAGADGVVAEELLDPGIYLLAGDYDWQQIWPGLLQQGLVEQQGESTFLLGAPIFIWPGASLTLDGVVLRIRSNRPAFIYNLGNLYVFGSSILGWDSDQGQPALLRSATHTVPWQERPFIFSYGNSKSFLVNSTLSNLGQPGFNFGLGLVFLSAQEKPDIDVLSIERFYQPSGQPQLVIVGSSVHHVYGGLVVEDAKSVAITSSDFQHNHTGHVNLKNISEPVLFANNLLKQSVLGDGFYLSSASDPQITGNLVVASAGDGISLFNVNGTSRLADNLLISNQGSGIYAKSSETLAINNNLILGNVASGIQVRDSAFSEVVQNHSANNGNYGFQFEFEHSPTANATAGQTVMLGRVSMLDNQIEENFDAAISAKGALSLTIKNNHFDSIGGPKFKGDLAAFGADILLQNNNPEGFTLCTLGDGQC